MYLEHWGLARSPFATGAAPPFYYEGESQAEAGARLRFVARQRRRLALVSGVHGAGKSLTLSHFANECRREGRNVVAVGLAGLSVREFLWQVTGQLALGPRPSDDAIALFRRLVGSVDSPASASATSGVLLLLDDADQAGPDLRAQLVRLLNLGGARSSLTLVLAAASEGVARLGRETLEATDLCIELEPWSEADTIGYIQHALLEAGCDRPAFDDEALAVLAALSDGVPRHVNRLADHALLAAAAAGLEAVDAGTVEQAHDALAWLATA